MRNVGVLILGMFIFTEGALAQGRTGAAVTLPADNSKTLTDFKNTLKPDQWTAIKQMGQNKPIPSKVCPTCTTVDHGQLVAHGLGDDSEPGSGQHIIMPIETASSLSAINSTLWDTLNALKGADKAYMDNYLADEKAHAPTILQQIELRSEYIHNLVSKLSKKSSGK
jgi:hypothetical protein